MAQLIQCLQCRGDLRIPESLIGQTVRCPTCGATFSTTAGPEGLLATEATIAAPAPPPAEPHQPPVEERLEEIPARRRYPRRDVVPHRGTLILILGIMGIVLSGFAFILGPIAWVMGQTDLKRIRAGEMDPEGEGNTNAGRILGIVATAFGALQCLIIGGILTFVLLAETSRRGSMAPVAPARPAPVRPRSPAKPPQPPFVDPPPPKDPRDQADPR